MISEGHVGGKSSFTSFDIAFDVFFQVISPLSVFSFSLPSLDLGVSL